MSGVGSLLSEYRKRSHLSQLELGMLAEVSPRHISFIETGRSRPSREMLMKLADTLGLSLHESNLLLHSSGYAAAFSRFQLEAPEMEPIRAALEMILDKQNPFPALVLDGDWNILMVNHGQQQLSNALALNPSDDTNANLLELVFDPGAYRAVIANWEEVAAHLLRRLRRQMIAYSKPAHVALFKKLLTMHPPANWQQPEYASVESPVLTVDIRLSDRTLKMFSTLSQFGTALDVGTEEILIENYFPADRASREFFES